MKNHTKWALAGAAVVAVGMVSLQQTAALWSDSDEIPGATLQAGTLEITAGNTSLNLDGFTMEEAAAGDSVQMPLPVSNNGTADMRYMLEGVDLPGEAPPMQLRVSVVDDADACPATGDVGEQLYSNPMQHAVTSWRPVGPGDSEVLCLRATIDQTAEGGQSGAATFHFLAESEAH